MVPGTLVLNFIHRLYCTPTATYSEYQVLRALIGGNTVYRILSTSTSSTSTSYLYSYLSYKDKYGTHTQAPRPPLIGCTRYCIHTAVQPVQPTLTDVLTRQYALRICGYRYDSRMTDADAGVLMLLMMIAVTSSHFDSTLNYLCVVIPRARSTS